MVGDFIICLLVFFNMLIYLLFINFLFQKKRGPERGLEGGPKRGPKRRVHVLSTLFFPMN